MNSLLQSRPAVLGLCILAAACGTDQAPGGAGAGADAPAAEAGATSDGGGAGASPLPGEVPPGNCAPGGPLCVQAPADGFLVESRGTVIEAGTDVQYCEVVEIPGEPGETIAVNAFESVMAPYSHHLNVRIVVPGSPADAATTPGDRVPCLNNGRLPFGSGLRQLYGSVEPEGSRRYPEGVGFRLQGGQKLVFNYHYYNPTPDNVWAKAVVTFHEVPEAAVTREVRRFGFYNTGFQVPAGAAASFVAECRMSEDVEILNLLRHTHAWGKDFEVLRAGGATDGERVFLSRDWEEDIHFAPTTTMVVPAGTGFRFRCDFENTLDQPLGFGELATDEMCILYGDFTRAAGEGLPAPEDCVILSSPPGGEVATGLPCAQCPDGE